MNAGGSAVRFLANLLVFAFLLAAMCSVAPRGLAQTTTVRSEGLAGPHMGEAVILSSPVEDRKLQVTVTAFSDPFEGGAAIRRGYRSVAAHVAMTNRGAEPFEGENSAIALLDDAGLYAFDMSWQYSDVTLKGYPPLRFERLEQGESAAGWLIFQISVEARPSAVIYLGYELPPYFTLLAWIDPVLPDQTGALPILEPSGKPKGTLTVDHIITNFERTDEGIDPVRGSSTLALAVTITNTSTETWKLSDENFWIIDQFGLYYHRVTYDRKMTSYQTFPDLGFRARPNQRVQGVLMFELPDGSDFTDFLYVQDDVQMFVVGGPDPGITITAEEAERVVQIDTRTSLDPTCAGIEDWAQESQVSMEAAAHATEFDSEVITAADLREAAASLSLVRQAQENVRVPEEAQQAQEDVLNLLTVTINALENAADRIDSGASPEAVIDNLESPRSPMVAAASTAVRSIFTLFGDDCPLAP